MKYLAAILLIAAGIAAADPIDTRVAPPVAQAVPAERPLAAVAVTDCDKLIVLLVVMPDGTTYVFDSKSPVPAEQATLYADTAVHRPLRYEYGCYRVAPTK